MKALKLAIIFLLIAGGVFLVFNLDSIIGEHGKESSPYGAKIDIQEQCEDIRSAWAEKKGWDKKLFEKHLLTIKQNNLDKMYSQEGYRTVINCLRENSINGACTAYSETLASSQFQDARLKKCYEGVEELKKTAINSKMEGMDVVSRDSRIKEVEDIHILYKNISSFVKSSHKVTPDFDMNSGWESFETLRSKEINRAIDFRKKKYYSKLSHLPGFADGLKEDKVREAVNRHSKEFFNSLSKQIIDAFSTLTPDNDNLAKLTQFSSKYMNEYKTIIGVDGNYGARALAAFQAEYRNKIEN